MDTFIAFIADNGVLVMATGLSIALAAFCAGSETAIVFSNKAHLRQMSEPGNLRAGTVLALTQERDHLHVSLMLIENFLIILSVILGTIIALRAFPNTFLAAAVTAVVMSAFVTFFAKLVPKGIACRNPDVFSVAVAPTLRIVNRFLSPADRILSRVADLMVGPGPQGMSCTAVVTEEDIKAM